MGRKLRIALLFGGRSAEHDVSLLSAANVYRAIDRDRYDVVLIGVARNGEWRLCGLVDGAFPKSVPDEGARVALAPAGAGRLIVTAERGDAPVEAPDAVSSPASPMSAQACSARRPPWTKKSPSD
jgi:D-alanine-D-alanine ligase